MSEKVNSSSRDQRPFVRQMVMTKTITIAASALDAGNTGQTHILREGLMLSRLDTGGKYEHYQPAGALGVEDADCILFAQVDLKDGDPGATSTDHSATVMWEGEAVSDHVLLYDAAAAVDLQKAGPGLGYIEFSAA